MDGEWKEEVEEKKVEAEEKKAIVEEKKEVEEEKKQEKEEAKEIKKPQLEKKEIRPKFNSSLWYDRNYKKLLLISVAVLIASLAYIFYFNATQGSFIYKDVTLTGGTVITIYTDKEFDIAELETALQSKLASSASVRLLEDIATRKQIAIVVETPAEAGLAQAVLEELLKLKLDTSNSSIETSSATLSQAFYKQLGIALAIAFLFMAIVVFIIFRTLIPSLAVIIAAFTDIVGALAIANLFGFRIGSAGIAAFLMLIGYSVDTDIMLTTKVIKRRGEGMLNTRLWNAAKTGLMMTLTSLIAVLVGFFIVESTVIKQIFFILSAGLFVDLISTWFGNASILKWYCTKKKIS